MHDDFPFQIGLRVVEFQCNKTLAGGLLELFQHALVTRVVGNRQAKLRRRFQQLTKLVDRHDAAVIGQRVDHHHRVLAGFHHFVQIANAACAHRAGKRAVHPDRLAALDQIASHQVGSGQVIMTGYGDERPFEPPGHVFHEAGFAAAGGAFQQYGQAVGVGGFEERNFVADWFVIRLGFDQVGGRVMCDGAH